LKAWLWLLRGRSDQLKLINVGAAMGLMAEGLLHVGTLILGSIGFLTADW
jgi:hypothetical protein